MKRFRTGSFARDLLDGLDTLVVVDDPGVIEEIASAEHTDKLEYAPVSKANELRYTLGPMYAPDVIDVHGEWADADEIRKAIWEFNERGSQRLRKQHGNERIGIIRELFQWPFEHEVELKLPNGKVTKSVTLPAGTAYAGVEWSETAWPDVKSGKITGLSMGGRAVRIRGVGNELKKLS